MNEIIKSNQIIRHHECDANGFVKLSSILDYFQDIAAEHADLLGCGMEDIAKRNLIWVLSKLRLEVVRAPKLGEHIEVVSYPTGVGKLFAYRQYLLSSFAGDLVRGSSDWILLDLKRQRAVSALRNFGDSMPLNPDKPRYFPELGRILVPETLQHCTDYRVGHGDIDLNRHLNNAVYARFVTDVVGKLSDSTPNIVDIQINFSHAALIGDWVECFGALDSNGGFYVEGIASDDRRYFQATGKIIIPGSSNSVLE